MYHLIAAGTHLFRVTDIGRTWRDVVSGIGSYFVSGGRYNRVQQRTVYAARDPLVSIAESAAHVALDRWQPRIGRGFLPPQPALPAVAPPFVSEHWLWEFSVNVHMQIVDLESPAAYVAFHHRPYELLNPSQAYRATADLADAVRLHPHPTNPNAMVDGILAPSVRADRVGEYIPRQEVLFVPASGRMISATFVRKWRLALEFRDNSGHSVTASTRLVDWEQPRFRLTNNAAPLAAYAGRPGAKPLTSGVWHRHQIRVRYT
jgi:RES domain